MSLPQTDKGFTTQLTDGTITIDENDGVKKLTVFNGTATTGTIQGDQNLNGTASTAIDIEEGESFNITSSEGSAVLSGFTITAPAGCTLKIIALR